MAGFNPNQALEALSRRLVEVWASQPEDAEAWIDGLRGATRQEKLCEALHRHGLSEVLGRLALLRGGAPSRPPAADREPEAAWYLQWPHIRNRCRELAETARKRQKLEEETSERRRLEAELQKSQQESRELGNRLAAAEAQARSAQSESATLKAQRKKLATRAAAAESAVTEMRQELQMAQDEHGKCQERCEELVARWEAEAAEHAATKERLSQTESDAAERRVEVERPQEESRGFQERCQQAEAARSVLSESNKVELQLENARLQERCEQFQQQLAKAEAERSAMLGQMQVLWSETGMNKERIRELERHLQNAKKSHHRTSGHNPLSEASCEEATDGQQPDLAEQLGYSFVDDDGTSSSVLSCSSWFSVKLDSMEPHCFMVDAIFKTRSYGTDFFLMGRDLKKGSQVVAGDDASILEVAKTPEICEASEVVELQAGDAVLRVTPDHLVQVSPKGDTEESLYLEAGKLKVGDLVMLDSGEPVALSSVVIRPIICQVLKIVFEPYLPVAVFSRPTCILSLGHKKKRPIRRGGRIREGAGPSDDSMDGGVSVPITAGEYMD
ncbi:unnamed protein product [Symbiodinium sp. CCMP2592]|nr:unnamed protein product [Symbiodinium sp. CCMP2592]